MRAIINSAIQYVCQPDWSFVRHWDDHTLWYVLGGSCEIQQGERRFRCFPDSCHVFEPGFTYRGGYLDEKSLSVVVVHFDSATDALPLQCRREYRGTNPLIIRDQLQRLLRQYALKHPAEAAEWLRTLCRTLNEDDQGMTAETEASFGHAHAIEELCRRIINAPTETYRIDELARETCLSPDHFRRVFKQHTGMSPKAWIIQCRIQYAKGLLLTTDYTLERIADACGFQNVFFFSRQFKKKTGIPPSRYRG